MVKQIDRAEIQHHIGLSKEMVEDAEYVLLPGDPARSEPLAKSLDPNPKFLVTSREHTSYLANFHGQNVLVCSTGLGAPNTCITMEELAVIDLKYFLRVGTCGAIQHFINWGDLIISTASVRLDGATKDCAPIEYPAVASFEFTHDIIEGAKTTDVPYHVGITASTDTFWQAQERYDNYTGYLLREKRGIMDEWRVLNVLNFEMESSAVFVMANIMKLHAACICGVVARRVESEKISTDVRSHIAQPNWEKVVASGIYHSMKRRNLIK